MTASASCGSCNGGSTGRHFVIAPNTYMPVRGPPGALPAIGYLQHPSTTRVYALYGGYVAPGEMEYQVAVGRGDAGRIPICVDGHRPLWDGHVVEVPGEKGGWTVRLHRPY
jgi:hypothetical protein